MEEKLDEIAQGKMEWTSMMNNFYPFLCDWIEHVKADSSLVNELLSIISCIRMGRASKIWKKNL